MEKVRNPIVSVNSLGTVTVPSAAELNHMLLTRASSLSKSQISYSFFFSFFCASTNPLSVNKIVIHPFFKEYFSNN